jgi:hypothetical protein
MGDAAGGAFATELGVELHALTGREQRFDLRMELLCVRTARIAIGTAIRLVRGFDERGDLPALIVA